MSRRDVGTIEVHVMHHLSLWTALKIRLAGWDYIDGYNDGLAAMSASEYENGDLVFDEDDDEDEDV